MLSWSQMGFENKLILRFSKTFWPEAESHLQCM